MDPVELATKKGKDCYSYCLQQPLIFIDIFGLCKYPPADAAAIAGIEKIYREMRDALHREYAFNIYRNPATGKYGIGPQVAGEAKRVNPPAAIVVPAGGVFVPTPEKGPLPYEGTVHTHGSGRARPSPVDEEFAAFIARSFGKPVYIGNHLGDVLKYDPYLKEWVAIRRGERP